jgi:hypothetical protein
MPESFAEQVNRVQKTKPVMTIEATTPETFAAQTERVNATAATTKQAGINVTLADERDPDQAGKVYDLSKRSGHDVNTVWVDPKKVERQANSYQVGTDPQIDDYMSGETNGMMHAVMSSDDGEALKAVHRSLGEKLVSSVKSGQANVELGNLRTKQMFGDTSAATEERIQAIKAERLTPQEARGLEPEGLIEKGLVGAAEQIPIYFDTLTGGLKRALPGAIAAGSGAALLGQLGPQVALPEEVVTVPGAAFAGGRIGFKFGSAEAIFNIEAGLAYDEFLDFRDETGAPLDRGVAWGAAVLTGAVNAGLEFASLGVLLKTIPGAEKLAKKPVTEILKKALRNPTVRQKVAKVFVKYGKAVGFEALTEATQELSTILFGEAAKAVSGEDFPSIPVEQAIERIKESGKAAIAPTIVFGLPGSAVGVYQATKSVHDSNDFHQNLDKDYKAVQETKTQERSPDLMRAALQSMGKTEEVHISAQGVDNILSQDAVVAQGIIEKLGVEVAVVKEGEAGIKSIPEDTAVTVDKILTLSQEEYDIIKDDVKEAPDSYTRREIIDNEAREDVENSAKVLEEDIAIQKEIDTEITRLTGEIAKTKLPDAKIAGDATIILRGLAEKLQSFGLDPAEMLRSISFKRTAFAEFVKRAKQLFQQEKIPTKNINLKMVESLGTTNDLNEAGYITPQGKLIDLSGELEGERSVPHDAIAKNKLGEQEFRALGNIRMDLSDHILNIEKEPTPSQYKIIASMAKRLDGELFLDLDIGLGEKVVDIYANTEHAKRLVFEIGTRPSEVIKVIKEYYKSKQEFFQATPIADELSFEIAEIESRIEKLSPEMEGGAELIERLKAQKTQAQEKLRATADERFETFFQATGKKRGAITIDGERKLIELFEGADLSTVLHEIGHVALLEYSAVEQSGKANDELKADMKTIREWVGNTGEAFTREQSEQFARGFEAYLREGKAPTAKLRAAFERFKQYLRGVYESAKLLRVTLNKDVRQVFDRMVAANAEVERAARQAGFVAKTDAEMDALGMSDVDKFNAKKLMDETVSKASELLSRDRNKGLKENREKWEREAKREIKRENPIYKTIDDIINDDNQLDRDDYLEFNEITDLPDRKLIKKDGKNIDMVAALYGFDDAEAMLKSFSETMPFNEAVDIRVAQKQAAHDASFDINDYLSDLKSYRDYQKLMAQYIAGATVDEAAINEGIQRNIKRWEKEARERNPDATQREIDDIVQDRIEAFRQKQLKPKALREAEIKRLAKETMAAKTVKEARRIDKFLSAMKKAASDERRAIVRKDWGAASTANELGRFNYEMASLSKDIRKEVDKVVDNAKRVGKLKPKETIRNEHKEAILHLISRYNLAPLSPRDPQTLPDYAALFAGDSFGRDGFPMPAFLSGDITDYRDMRMEQLRELDNAIRYLEGQGKIGKEKVLADGFTLIEDVAKPATVVLDKMKPKKKWEKGSMMRKLNDKIDEWFAALDSLEFTIKSADNYTNLGKDGVKGVLERNVIDPIKRGLNALALQQGDIKAQLEPHLEQIRKTNRKWRKKFGRHINIEGVNLPDAMIANKQTKGWFDYQIWAIALNTGNTGEKSNRENLRNGYGLTDGEIDAIRDMLTVEDMRAVQGIWDTVNSLYTQADAQFLKDNNYHLQKIEATPFTFKGEEFKGGYYPIKHDKELSRKVKERQVREDFFDNEGGKITTPYTNRGATNARLAGVSLPIRLNLSVIDSHFRDTLHYIHLTDPIRDADRITRYSDDQTDVTASMSNVLGEKVYDTIRPALQHIANPRKEGIDTPGASELEWLRGASTAFILAWNTGVALKQPFSTFGAIRDMGVTAYVKGFSSTLMSPPAHHQKMMDLSPYMNNRQSSFDRELKSAFLKLSEEQRGLYFGDKKVTWQDVRNFGFWQIRVADAVTVLPIWHGAFNDKLNSDQSNLLEAVAYADDIVRNSQPSAQPLDLSEWQRHGGWHRLFSQFQTFTVGKYGQRQRLFYRAWKQGQISNLDYAWFNFMDAFVPLVSMNMLFALLQGRDLGDEEEQKKMMADVLTSWATMGVPVAGNIARSLATGWGDPLDTPVLQTGNKLVRGIVSGFQSFNGFENEKEKERAMWGVAHALSIIAGVPLSKIVARAQKGAKQKKGVPGIKYLIPAHK